MTFVKYYLAAEIGFSKVSYYRGYWIHISNVVFTPDMGNLSETTMMAHGRSDVVILEELNFTKVRQDCPY